MFEPLTAGDRTRAARRPETQAKRHGGWWIRPFPGGWGRPTSAPVTRIDEDRPSFPYPGGPPPRTAGPWVVLARQLLAEARTAEAVAAVEMALALDPRHLAARALRKTAVEALEAADPALTALELAAALHPEDRNAQLELGHTYVELDRPADAERCFKRVLEAEPQMAAAQASLAALYLSVGIEDGAEHHARLALQGEAGQAVASQTLAAILERRGEPQAARELLDQAYRRQSLFLEPARNSLLTVLVLATQASGNIPYRSLLPPNRYSRLVWYMEHAREDQIGALPPYDVVFNAIGDPDLAGPTDAPVRRFLSACRRPVLNDPGRVARTHRHQMPELLGGLDHVVVPAAARLDGAAVGGGGLRRAIEDAGLALPVLVRPVGSHGGRGLARAESWGDVAELDAALAGERVYLTQYRDYRSADGRFRKGRMIFVDRRPYPYHWAVSDDWMVHYETSGMRGDRARQAEEQMFLASPETVIGPRAVAAMAEIGRRLDLDYCGLDFSVLDDGRVLVFEANATMLVHPEDPDGELAYKNPAVGRIVGAFQARVAALAKLLRE